MNAELSFRPATGGDAEQLSTLAFRSKAHWGYSLEFMQACRAELTYSAEVITAPQSYFYICEHAGQTFGFYALQFLGDQVAELEALFVSPKNIGEGIGTAMIDHCKSVALQAGIREIVIQGDPNAEEFYLSVGAHACGYRESASIRGRQLPVFTITL